MPDAHTLQGVIEAANHAATLGDFAEAERLLRRALDLQVAKHGPAHPDLIETLNNLAVASEKAGHLNDAEDCYRRASTMASAIFEPHHPLVSASRDNLRDFCAAHGVGGENEAVGLPLSEAGPSQFPAESVAPREADTAQPPVHPPLPSDAKHESPVLERGAPVVRPEWPAAEPVRLKPAAPRREEPRSRLAAATVAIVAVLGVVAALLLWPDSDRDNGTVQVSAPPPAEAPARESTATATAIATAPTAVPPSVVAPAVAPAGAAVSTSPTVPNPASSRNVPPATLETAPAATASGTLTVRAEALCRSLATGTGGWRCEPASDPAPAGRLTYYTRVSSSTATRIRHRWFQGDQLRHEARLTIDANASAGYRTYSALNVSPGAWRVDLVDTGGAVLGSTRFVVVP